ncbi:MAG: hypothetical protein JWO94_1010 [Verrucomicrobiaceae bacterium]|nr:hypothetical protein [Verrucomicrobiaceae bacterium]
MGLPAEKLYTLDEYVALEVATGIKHEYDQGRVTAMAGGTPQHAMMAANVIGSLRDDLKGKPCKPVGSDLKLGIGDRFFYADVAVLCPPVKRAPELPDAIINPRVVFEVLSDSTEAYDRGEKFALYRQNEELIEYILISPTRVYAEHYTRAGTGSETWNLAFLGPESILHLTSIDCEVSLASLYEGMEMLAA